MKRLLKFIRIEKGQMMVISALAMTALIGFAALSVDTGRIYMTKSSLQNAADAAALAGAQELPDNPMGAVSAANQYLANNGITDETVEVTVGEENKSIKVTVERNLPMTLASVVGFNNADVKADTTVNLGVAASVPWIVPFVIPKPPADSGLNINYEEIYVMRMYGAGPYPGGYKFPNDFLTTAPFKDYTTTYRKGDIISSTYKTNGSNTTIYDKSSGGNSIGIISKKNTEVIYVQTSGSRYKIQYNSKIGWVDKTKITVTQETAKETFSTNNYPYQFDYMNVYIEKSSDFNDYIYWLENGYSKTFSLNQKMYYFDPSSGGKQSVDAFARRVSSDKNSDYKKAKVGDPRVILIPIVEGMLPRNTKDWTEMTIIGFTGFFIDKVHKNSYGESFWFEGRFLEDLNIGTGEVTYDPNADFGLRVVKITK